MCPSPVLPHAISAQNCAEFEVKHKSKSSWTHSNPGTWKLVLILKWKTDWLVANISPTKDSTKIWNGLYCISWNTILSIPDPESKTISRDSGVGRYRNEVRTNSDYRICTCSILYGLVCNPGLPPESLGQIGFGAGGDRTS